MATATSPLTGGPTNDTGGRAKVDSPANAVHPIAAEVQCLKTSEAIWKAFSTSETQQQFLNRFIESLVQHFDSPYATLVWETNVGNLSAMRAVNDEASTVWNKRCSGNLLDTRYRNIASAKPLRDLTSGVALVILSCPIAVSSTSAIGALCLVTAYRNKETSAAQLRELQALVGMASTMALDVAAKKNRTSTNSSQDASSAAKAAGYQSLTEFAYAITNNLKAKLGCESVSFGIVKANRVQLLSMSGTAVVDHHASGTQLLQQVMEECLDADEICSVQAAKGNNHSTGVAHLLHRRWQSDSSGAAVASIPLKVSDSTVAILSLRHVPGESFSSDSLDKVKSLAEPLMPGAMLLQRADRKLLEHAQTSVVKWAKQKLATDSWTRRLVLGSILAGIFVVAIGKQDYYLTLPCAVAPHQEREIAMPIDGKVIELYARAGDAIHQGQLLAKLDTRQLELDYKKARAEHESARVDAIHGSATGDHQKMAVGQARADAAWKLAQKLERQIEQSEIRSPVDGTILATEIEKRVGESLPIGESLFLLAPLGQWKVKIDVPEFATNLLRAGQSGQIATLARPNAPIPLQINYVSNSAEVREGKNLFTSEAPLVNDVPTWLRAGMHGTARVHVGRHPIWWVWTHRWIDHFRLKLWKV